MTEKGFDCEHNRHRWEQCEACAEERGYRAGIEAAASEIERQQAVAGVQGHKEATAYLEDLLDRMAALSAPAAPKEEA